MSDTSTNGHTPNGKFAPGNKHGKGNPHIDRVAKLRVAMLSAVTEKAMKNVIKKLIELAESGDIKAIALLLDRTVGKVETSTALAVQVHPAASGAPKDVDPIPQTPESRRETAMRIVARIRSERAAVETAEAG